MKEVHQENGVWHLHFDNVSEIRDAVVPSHNRRREADIDKGNKPEWYGTHGGLPAVHKLVEQGWPEGLRRVREHMGVIEQDLPRVITRRRRKARGPQGDELDIHRVYSGHLNRAWSCTKRVETNPAKKHGRRVVLSLNLSAHWALDASQLFWRGAAIVVLCERLQQAGYAVKVVAMHINNNLLARQHNSSNTSVTLKEFDQRMNLEHITVATALAGFHRAYMFKANCMFSVPIDSGQGHPRSLQKVDMFEREASMHLHVDNVFTHEAAVRKVKEILSTSIMKGAAR